MLGSMDSALPPKSERPVSLRRPLRQLSLGQDPLPASPLISTRNLVPGLSDSVVKLERLGKGATSNVFRAVHAATLKMIALKEVTVSTDADRRAVRTEMRALRTQRSPLLTSTFTTELASCPRIVDYYGSVVQENGNACIAVEYVAGGSLGSWLDSGCLCPEAWIAHIAHQALEALDFVHSCGRVHRDVKPANLLITKNGDVKLGDFGAAGVENSSRMVGTQRFMAPERLKGRPATAQSDLWSLGLSLATAALGDDFIAQASNHFEQLDLAGRVRRTLAKATTLSPELTDFLHQCLSRDPARRPALRELMKHPFLDQRHGWQSKCPEVALAMRDRKRRQREDASGLGAEAVIGALCQVRAEDNLGHSRVDPATAADLAYELGVTARGLARDVHLQTLELVRERGGGGAPGVSDSGGDNGDEDGGGRRLARRRPGAVVGGGGGIASDGAKRRNRRMRMRGGDSGDRRSCGAGNASGRGRRRGSGTGLCMGADGSRSPPTVYGHPRASAGGQGSTVEVAPVASVGGRNGSMPPTTPRSRPMTAGEAVGGTPSASARKNPSSSRRSNSSSRSGVIQLSPTVRLTPRKRRGERKSSQTRRNGCCCCCQQATGTRRSRSRRGGELCTTVGATAPAAGEKTTRTAKTARPTPCHRSRERGSTAAAGSCRSQDCGCGPGTGGDAACRRSGQRKAQEKPRTAASRTLPSRADVSLRSMRSVFQLADEMKAEITVRDRVHRLRVYPNCFSGREAVQWMLDGCHASSVDEAEKLGNEMMKASVFQHILNSHVFEDSSVYYQFTDGETPAPPATGGRRLREIVLLFGGHVARKLVYGGASSASGASTASTAGPSSAADSRGGEDVADSGLRKLPSESHNRCATGCCLNPTGKAVGKVSSPTGGAEGAAECVSSPSSATTKSSTSRPSSTGGKKKPPVWATPSAFCRSKHKRRHHGSRASGSQLRRFSSSVSTVTVPETPY